MAEKILSFHDIMSGPIPVENEQAALELAKQLPYITKQLEAEKFMNNFIQERTTWKHNVLSKLFPISAPDKTKWPIDIANGLNESGTFIGLNKEQRRNLLTNLLDRNNLPMPSEQDLSKMKVKDKE